MTKSKLAIYLLLLFYIISFVFIGCGASKTSLTQFRSSARSELGNQFTPAKISSLSVGMPVNQIEYLFGPPDVKETKTFGEDIGEPWEGLVYKYYTKPDPKYKYVERRFCNMFVFYLSKEPPVLNNWIIEEDLSSNPYYS